MEGKRDIRYQGSFEKLRQDKSNTFKKISKTESDSDMVCIIMCKEFGFRVPYKGSEGGQAAGDKSVKQVSCHSEQ